ncbi:rhodanese-like domain-containing protein [bacterium]|nr:rhodanese-like domain-containing protein [bacterium]
MNSTYVLIAVLIVGFLFYSRAQANVPKISPEEAREYLTDSNYQFIDVRTDGEYDSGHIPNSMHIPLHQIQDRMSEIDLLKNKNIIAYCRSGARSSKATKILVKAGFDVLNLSGGVLSWKGDLTKK